MSGSSSRRAAVSDGARSRGTGPSIRGLGRGTGVGDGSRCCGSGLEAAQRRPRVRRRAASMGCRRAAETTPASRIGRSGGRLGIDIDVNLRRGHDVALGHGTDGRRADGDDQHGRGSQGEPAPPTRVRQPAPTERLLHDPPRDDREDERDDDQAESHGEIGAHRSLFRGGQPDHHRPEDEDRPVPEVQRVGDTAQRPERRPPSPMRTREPATQAGGDDGEGTDGGQQCRDPGVRRRRLDQAEAGTEHGHPHPAHRSGDPAVRCG